MRVETGPVRLVLHHHHQPALSANHIPHHFFSFADADTAYTFPRSRLVSAPSHAQLARIPLCPHAQLRLCQDGKDKKEDKGKRREQSILDHNQPCKTVRALDKSPPSLSFSLSLSHALLSSPLHSLSPRVASAPFCVFAHPILILLLQSTPRNVPASDPLVHSLLSTCPFPASPRPIPGSNRIDKHSRLDSNEPKRSVLPNLALLRQRLAYAFLAIIPCAFARWRQQQMQYQGKETCPCCQAPRGPAFLHHRVSQAEAEEKATFRGGITRTQRC